MRGIQRSNRNTFGVGGIKLCDVAASGGKSRDQRPHRSIRHTVVLCLGHTACGVDQHRRVVGTRDCDGNRRAGRRAAGVRDPDVIL